VIIILRGIKNPYLIWHLSLSFTDFVRVVR